MASALDEDTRRTLDAGRETAGAMLRAAQKDLQKVFIVFLVGFLGTFYALRLYVWDILKGVTRAQMEAATAQTVQIIAQTPFDVILLQAKIGLTVGIVVAIPPLLYFSRDALRERGVWPSSPVPRWQLALLGAVVAGLFVAGVAYGYLVFFPFVFAFLANNAISANFTPTYSIVLWAEFIFLLTISFGLAAQMPLVVTGLAYTEVVPYETFRDRWRHAVVGIFVFGALFSPPDPFTQVMWAAPLLVLYGASLYLAKVVVTARRGSERLELGRVVRAHWNVVAAGAVVAFAAVYFLYTPSAVAAVNDVLARYSSRRFAAAGDLLPFAEPTARALLGGLAGAVGLVLAVGYAVYRDIAADAAADGPPAVAGAVGDPAAIDIGPLDAAGVRAAPPEAFAAMTEGEALELAGEAMDDGDAAKARAVLDRFDEAHAGPAGEAGDVAGAARPTGTWAADTGSLLAAVRVGRDRVDWRERLRTRWNLPLFVGMVAFAAVYVVYGTPLVPTVTAAVPAVSEFVPRSGLPANQVVLLAGGAVAVVVAALSAVGYAVVAAYRAGTDPGEADLGVLETDEMRTAPDSLFAGVSEAAVTREADRSMAAGDDERARLVLDRYDAVHAAHDEPADGEAAGDETPDGAAARAGSTFVEELTGGETDEDDIGGYYDDVVFVLDSLTSKSFRIVATFVTVLAVTFGWLYTGGIGDVREDFLSRLPAQVVPTDMTVVALHPVEVLIFEVKVSTLVAALAVLPLMAYYAWPALRDRSVVRGHRYVIFGWTTALVVGLVGGSVLGYTFVAPSVISWLVADAVQANMLISYRITNFFWLIIATTAGIGFLADIPVVMVLLNTAGVPYRSMRGRWREVTVGILAFAALFTSASIVTMFLVTIPLMAAYGTGLAVLFVLTLGGRRDLAAGRTSEA